MVDLSTKVGDVAVEGVIVEHKVPIVVNESGAYLVELFAEKGLVTRST